MNTKQTKLTKDQKRDVREQMVEFDAYGGFVFSFPEYAATVACRSKFPGASMADFSIAMCAADEHKFRKLVGADIAMLRHAQGQTLALMVAGDDFDSMQERAREFAEFVTY